MNPLPIFVLQFAWFLAAWTVIATHLVAPRLAATAPDRALALWLAPQLFRVLGSGLLVPTLAPDMPRAFALPTALGDALTAVLALAAIVALERRRPSARTLAWTCNVVGSCDVVIALVHAARIEAARHLAAQWYVAAVLVPLVIVSHAMVYRTLLADRT